ncbi:hypothetical protein RSAG8_10800, partial [Rhizoctonia solani AG-8 WAC10335]
MSSKPSLRFVSPSPCTGYCYRKKTVSLALTKPVAPSTRSTLVLIYLESSKPSSSIKKTPAAETNLRTILPPETHHAVLACPEGEPELNPTIAHDPGNWLPPYRVLSRDLGPSYSITSIVWGSPLSCELVCASDADGGSHSLSKLTILAPGLGSSTNSHVQFGGSTF